MTLAAMNGLAPANGLSHNAARRETKLRNDLRRYFFSALTEFSELRYYRSNDFGPDVGVACEVRLRRSMRKLAEILAELKCGPCDD